jgi:hypothetical protein
MGDVRRARIGVEWRAGISSGLLQPAKIQLMAPPSRDVVAAVFLRCLDRAPRSLCFDLGGERIPP